MRDMLAACGVGYLESIPLLDINHDEEMAQGPSVVLALQSHSQKVVYMQQDNKITAEAFDKVSMPPIHPPPPWVLYCLLVFNTRSYNCGQLYRTACILLCPSSAVIPVMWTEKVGRLSGSPAGVEPATFCC